MKNINIFFLFCCIFFFSCKQTATITNDISTNTNEYAVHFSIEKNSKQLIINTVNNKQLVLPFNFRINSCMVTTTSAFAYIDILGESNKIIGVTSPNYFYNSKVAEGIQNNSIADIGNDGTLNFEKIIALKPDVIFASPTPAYEKTFQMLEKSGIKIIYIEEFKELHPLGKTEYLKLYGTLFQKLPQADSLYQSIKTNYFTLKNKVKNITSPPKVFTNIIYSGSWYMPGGNSFIASLFNDAQTDYIWKDTQEQGVVPLSFEEVFSKAKDAEYWIGASNFSSKQEMLGAYNHYQWFAAYKNDKIYTMNARENALKANDYYESGTIYADKVLADIIKITHPAILPEYTLTYLKKLE